jgi:tagatose-6-phosphate ketose/aldose isomerase
MSQAHWQVAWPNINRMPRNYLAVQKRTKNVLDYFHTLHEICQQPWTWLQTSERMIASRESLIQIIKDMRSVTLTGSGSSQYAAECVHFALQNTWECGLRRWWRRFINLWRKSLASGAARSCSFLSPGRRQPGEPGAIEFLLNAEPKLRHIVVTCNEQGSLAKEWRDNAKVHVITIPKETNDQSLVMTSSFTNLLLATRFMGMLGKPDEYLRLCKALSAIAKELIATNFDVLAETAKSNFERVVFLGSGARFGASREAALKMLEMTAGRVTTLCETYLGFRHGPMSYVQEKTLIVCFLSSDSVLRAYELDLLQELDRKNLGLSKLIVGERIPESTLRKEDVAIDCPGLAELGDEEAATIDVVVAQLLGFFRCLKRASGPIRPPGGLSSVG